MRHLMGSHKRKSIVSVGGNLDKIPAGNILSVGVSAQDFRHDLHTHAQILAQHAQKCRRTGFLLCQLPGVFVVHKAAFAACAADELHSGRFPRKAFRRIGKASLIRRRLHGGRDVLGRVALDGRRALAPHSGLIHGGESGPQPPVVPNGLVLLHLVPRLCALLAEAVILEIWHRCRCTALFPRCLALRVAEIRCKSARVLQRDTLFPVVVGLLHAEDVGAHIAASVGIHKHLCRARVFRRADGPFIEVCRVPVGELHVLGVHRLAGGQLHLSVLYHAAHRRLLPIVGGLSVLCRLIGTGHPGPLPYHRAGVVHSCVIRALRRRPDGHVSAAHQTACQTACHEVQRHVLHGLAQHLFSGLVIVHAARHIYGDPLLHVRHAAVDCAVEDQVGEVGEHFLAALDARLHRRVFQRAHHTLLCRTGGQLHGDQAFQTELLKSRLRHTGQHAGQNSLFVGKPTRLCLRHGAGGRRAAQRRGRDTRRDTKRRKAHRGGAVQYGRPHAVGEGRSLAVVALQILRHGVPHAAGIGIWQERTGFVVHRAVWVAQLPHRCVKGADTAQQIGRNGRDRGKTGIRFGICLRRVLHLGIPFRVLLPLGDIPLIVHQLRDLVVGKAGFLQGCPRCLPLCGVRPLRGQRLHRLALLRRQVLQRRLSLDVVLDVLGLVVVGLHGGIGALLVGHPAGVIAAKRPDVVLRPVVLRGLFGALHLLAVAVQVETGQTLILLDIRRLLRRLIGQLLLGFLPPGVALIGKAAQKRAVGGGNVFLFFLFGGRSYRLYAACRDLRCPTLFFPFVKGVHVNKVDVTGRKSGFLHFLLVDILPTHWPSSFICRDSSAHIPNRYIAFW